MKEENPKPDIQYRRVSEYGIPSVVLRTGEAAVNGVIQFSTRAGEYLQEQIGCNLSHIIKTEAKTEAHNELLEVNLEPGTARGVLDMLQRLRQLEGEGSMAQKLYLEFVQAVGRAAHNNMAIDWLQDLRIKTGLRLIDLNKDKPVFSPDRTELDSGE